MVFVVFVSLSLMLLYFGFRKSGTLVNPLSVFSGVWLLIVLLYQLRLSGLQTVLNQELYLALTIVLLAFGFFYFLALSAQTGIFGYMKRNELVGEVKADSENLRSMAWICFALFCVWFVVSLIEICMSGGVPAFWLFTDSGKTYFDFGIPSVHGLMNALGVLLATVASYLLFKDAPHKRQLLLVLIIETIFYLLIISRQVIMSAAVQILVVYLLVDRKPIPVMRLCLIGLFGIVAFGVIGNIRTGYQNFMEVAELSQNMPSAGAGFYWVYMYLTMTLANLNNLVIQTFEPLGVGYLLQDFVPSVVSDMFDFSQAEGVHYLASIQFNVSGFFAHYFEAFGWSGLIVAGGAFGALSGLATSWYEWRPSAISLFFLAVTMQIVALSFFTDLLLYLPVSFQLVLLCLFGGTACSTVETLYEKWRGHRKGMADAN